MILFKDRPGIEQAWWVVDYKVVMCGGGDDTAMLIAEMYERGYEPDEIVFCDTGSEFKHTYAFIEHLKKWCEDKKWSKVVVLNKFDKNGNKLSVIGNAEKNNTLPSAAFGSKSCSLRFKVETADKYFNNNVNCHKAWGVSKKGVNLDKHTGSILRIVGLNADEQGRVSKWSPEHKWVQVFPLYDWDIGEKESDAVERVGLYYPNKSSCICCPHLTGAELVMLRDNYLDDFNRIIALENNFISKNKTVESSTIGMCRRKTIQQKITQHEIGSRDFSEESKCSSCHG